VADVTTQELRFGVPDMAKFDEQKLRDALKGQRFNSVTVLSKPKA
jgi:hypothetical protein